MSKLPPKENVPLTSKPYDAEGHHGQAERNRIDQMRKQSGGLPDDPIDNPVHNTQPFKDLKSGK